MILICFASGLAFFALGLIVALERAHAHSYPFRKALPLLAGYGFARAAKKWLDMAEIEQLLRGFPSRPGMDVLELTLLVAAFLMLAAYGLWVWRQVDVRQDWRRWLLPGLALLWAAGAAVLHITIADNGTSFAAADVWARYAVGLPSSALLAYALLLQRRELTPRLGSGYSAYMYAAFWAAIVFAVLDQVIGPRSVLWPSAVLNEQGFWALFSVPVQTFRVIAIAVMAYALIRGLGALELADRKALAEAQNQALHAEEARRLEAEEHSVQLSRLARELSALLETTRIVASRLDLDTLAKEAIERIVELFDGVECGCILVTSPSTGRLETQLCTGTDAPCERALSLAERVVHSERGSLTLGDELPSVMVVPLRSENWVLGVMSLANQHEAGRFTERELQQAQALANQVAVGMEKAWLYRELQRREQMLKRLLERVVAAQEEERKRIARELHDETGQSLTALVTGLSALENVVVSDPKLAEKRLKQLLEFGVQAMDEIDRLIADLRPTLLDDLGLVAALRWLVESNKDRLPPVQLELSLGKTRLPRQLEVELFRIAQESLKNIMRHAHAKQVRLSLKAGQQRVQLFVEDDGAGFDPQAAMDPLSPRPAWGLLGMRERAEGLGGAMSIESRPGAGTRISLNIPLMEEVRLESDPSAPGR
jgi:signal transduction histidine kinase